MNPESLHAAYWERLAVLVPNTLMVSSLTTLLAGGFGLLLGLLLFATRVKGRRWYLALLAAGLMLPLHSVVTAWYALYSRLPISIPDVLLAAMLMAPGYIPLMGWISGLALALVDPDREEAARLDGGWRQVFRFVIFPEARPVFAGGLLLLFILSSGEIIATDILRVRTFAEEIFTQFQLRQTGQVFVDSLVLLALILLLTAALVYSVKQMGGISLDGLARRLSRGGLARPIRSPAWLPALLLLLLLGTPLGFLLYSMEHPDYIVQAIQAFHEELLYTLILASITAVAIAVASVLLAWPVMRSKHRTFWLFVLTALALLPAALVGYAMIRIFNWPGPLGEIYDSPLIVILTWLVRFVPLMTLIACPFVAKLPAELREAGAIDGLGPLGFAIRILLPVCRPLIAVEALLAFALVIGEIGATALVAPPGTTLLSVRIFTLLHYGVYYDVAGAALMLFLPMALIGLAIFFIAEKLIKAYS